jgi:hypothetical protein
MSNLTNTIPTILKYLSNISSFPLRWYYTDAMLDQFLKIDISACGGPINYIFSSQEGSCWLNVYNLSPFDYTIDRIKVEVCLNGEGSFSCEQTMPILIKGMSDHRIHIHGKSPMTPEAATASKASKEAWASINAYVITSIRKFEIRRQLTYITNVRVNA